MKTKRFLGASLIVVAAVFQAGCTRDAGTSPDAAAVEKTGANRERPAAPRAARPPSVSVTLPGGTPLVVRTTTALSTSTQVAGQPFTAHLEQPLVLGSREIAARGAEVEGRIVESDKGGRVKGVATIAVQMTRLYTSGGHVVDISTDAITRDANATKGKDATKIGIGSGVGAAIGGIVGGGKGAAIGAAAGAGAGTGTVLGTHGDAAVIPSESVLHFTLRAPLTVAQSR